METKLTFNEIMDKLKTVYSSVDEFAYGYTEDAIIPDDFEPLQGERSYVTLRERAEKYWSHIGIGEYKQIEQYGGEGEGETWYVVYHFVEHDVYIRVDGFYQSYNGTEFYDGWDCCREVRPKEKTITVYE